MGFMDKVKAKAQDVAAEAKKAAEVGKVKVDRLQLKRKQDEAAKQLGYLIHTERAKGTPSGAEVDRLIAEISSLQSQMDEIEAAAAAEGGSGDPATPPPPPAPEFPTTNPATGGDAPTSGESKP
jgi:seryl-tRNA synthetase